MLFEKIFKKGKKTNKEEINKAEAKAVIDYAFEEINDLTVKMMKNNETMIKKAATIMK